MDGRDVRQISISRRLRSLFSLVLQDVHLFSGTIGEQHQAGRARRSPTSGCARRPPPCTPTPFIERLPQGFDSAVAERGATLSVGQKQLLSFARALAFDPRVLILDEATSSVDTETELLIRDALAVLMAGRTTIAIAHRLSTIQDMDKILVLHKGQLREAGTHQELLARRGIYFRLYQLRSKDQESTAHAGAEGATANAEEDLRRSRPSGLLDSDAAASLPRFVLALSRIVPSGDNLPRSREPIGKHHPGRFPLSSLRRLAPYLLRYRTQYLIGLVSVTITAGLSLLSPWVLQRAIDELGRTMTGPRLAAYGLVLLALAGVGGAARFLMRRIVIGASREIEFDLRNDFFAHLGRLPFAYFQGHRTGDLMSRAMNDLEAVRLMVGISFIDAFNTLIVFVVAIALMVSIDLRLTLIALAPLPFVSVAVKLFGAAIYRRFQRVQAQLADMTAITQEGLSGVRVVRSYGQEEQQVERFTEATRRYFRRNRALIRLQSIFYATMTFFLGLGAVLVLWVGSSDVIAGRMTLGEFVAFGAYQVMLGVPMVAFGSLTNTVQRGIASWRRLLEVLDAPEVDAAGAADAPARIVRGAVEFRHLTFAYGEDQSAALEDVSFRVEPGQTVALVGPTGSGKSTLLQLLPRLHEPPRGAVFLDGVDVRDLPLEVLRAAIGFVPQEPFLFSDSLVENIAFAPPAGVPDRRKTARREDPPRTRELLSGGFDLRGTGTLHLTPGVTDAVRRAAAIARLEKDLPALPRGYETPLGERGVNLSGGQRQRTALARALVIDPVVLVLDDALSAVDTRTEDEILRGLHEEMRKRTAIVVSNRISTIRDADLILVFDNGRIVERGRHAQLVARGGVYAELHRKQLLQDALAAS